MGEKTFCLLRLDVAHQGNLLTSAGTLLYRYHAFSCKFTGLPSTQTWFHPLSVRPCMGSSHGSTISAATRCVVLSSAAAL